MSSVTRQAGRGRQACSFTVLALASAAMVFSLGCTSGRVFQQGNAAARTGDWDLAVSYYKKAAEKSPSRQDYRINLERAMLAASRGHLAKAHSYEEQDQLDFALRSYRKVIEFDGANQEARANIQRLEQTIRDRIEASRPRPAIEQLREKARQVGPEPTLNPASREPLTLTFKNAQLKDILNFVGASTGINVTYDKDFADKAYSVDLAGVTLEQALQQILTANVLFFKVLNERSIIVVPDTTPKRTAYEEQAIQTFFLSHADPTEMLALLNVVLRPQQAVQSVFAANKGNNTITVRGTVPMLQIVERVIQSNDRPRAEIVVDVEILEVNRARAKQYGLELSEYSMGLVFSPESKPGGSTSGTGGTASSGSFGRDPLPRIRFRNESRGEAAVARSGRREIDAEPRHRGSCSLHDLHAHGRRRPVVQPPHVFPVQDGRCQSRDRAARHLRGRCHYEALG
jgi:general secretion pathway protein D